MAQVAIKCDYKNAIAFIKEKLTSTKKITRDELNAILNGDVQTNQGRDTLAYLRSKLKHDNITIKYNHKDAIYYISQVDVIPEICNSIEVKRTSDETQKNLSALEKDNKNLFIENASLKEDIFKLKAELDVAHRMVNEIQEKYNTLINITAGLSKLAGVPV